MKQFFFVIGFVFLLNSNLFAQSDLKPKSDSPYQFGVRLAYEAQVNKSDYDFKANLPQIGVFSDIRLSDRWSLLLELNLRSTNNTLTLLNGETTSWNSVKLRLPILFKYKLNNKLSFYAGSQTFDYSFTAGELGLKKWNAILGAQYNLSEKFYLEARFRHGLENRSTFLNDDFRLNTISLGIGYKF